MQISVVIPLYNKERTILRAIQSVLIQTHQDFQIIVVNDGSTDRSVELVESLDNKKIKVVTQDNKGVSVARNRGVQESVAEWVSFLDADDEYHPFFLESILMTIKKIKDVAFVGSDYSGRVLDVSSPKVGEVRNYCDLFTGSRSAVHSSSFAVNREVFISMGGYVDGQSQFEDWTLYFKLAISGKFCFIDAPLSVYHTDEQDASKVSDFDGFFENAAKLIEEVSTAFLKPNVKNDSLVASINRFVVSMALFGARNGIKLRSIAFYWQHIGRIGWKMRGSIPMFRRFVLLILTPKLMRKILQNRKF